jgi:hypothetical protein
MASILRVNTLTDASSGNSTAMSTIFNGSAKAWINMNGTGTVAIRDSYNIASITDNGAGDYTQTFTGAFTNNDYAPASVTQDDESDTANGTASMPSIYRSTTGMTTSAMRLGTSVGSPRYDITGIFASVHGDLA